MNLNKGLNIGYKTFFYTFTTFEMLKLCKHNSFRRMKEAKLNQEQKWALN